MFRNVAHVSVISHVFIIKRCNLNQSEPTSWTLDTLLVHASTHRRTPNDRGIPTVQPIYTSTTYLHSSAEALDRAFNGRLPSGEQAYVYARQGNPNNEALEQVMASIEGGVGAVAFASGMAAIHAALLAAGLTTGAKILVAQDLYGSTLELLRKIFVPIGIELAVADLCCSNAADIIQEEQPDIVFVETLSNPLVKVTNLMAIGNAASQVEATSIVDSTFTTPYLVRPIEHGFDLVVHSGTKYIGGHGDSTAGIVISAKNTLLDQLRSYCTILGAMISPLDSYLIMRGLKTLGLRMERQCNNALQVAQFLQQHPAIERVHYPGLPDHPQHELAARLLHSERYGGLLSFELKEQSREAVFRFMDSLRLCLPATTLGDIYSEVSYPPISSHRTLTSAERHKIGITDGCIRLSAGIEDARDIIADLNQALSR